MKKLITATAFVLVATSAAYAADEKPMGRMGGDMMKSCQEHMKDGKMMDSMPKDMMSNCQEMMKNGGMMKGGMMGGGMGDMKSDSTTTEAPKADHKKHHAE